MGINDPARSSMLLGKKFVATPVTVALVGASIMVGTAAAVWLGSRAGVRRWLSFIAPAECCGCCAWDEDDEETEDDDELEDDA